MAVDKKSDHVGNHGGVYTDINGISKQFTYVDHDKKTKISTYKESLEDLKKQIADHAERKYKAILALPAVNCLKNRDGIYEAFVVRDQKKGIIWNEQAVKEVCSSNPTLANNLFNITWRTTVKEIYWFDNMSYEDIAKGNWKKLI